MITVAKLRRKPRHFQAFTGVSIAEFDQLFDQIAPAYEADQQRRRNRGAQPRPPMSDIPSRWNCPNDC